MEWMNKGERPAPTAPATVSHSGGKKGLKFSKGVGLATVVLLFSATIVVVGVLLYSVLSGNGSESRFVNSKRLQAVFLNGGQVYFGNIENLNDKYIRMSHIYYLRVNQTVQPDGTASSSNQDISLVKLGCELHAPTDEMLINREQVVFWENLKSGDEGGQVAKAVADYIAKNPKGEADCTAQSSTTSTGTSTGTQNGSTTGTGTTGTGTTGTGTTGTGTTGTGTTGTGTPKKTP